MNDLEYISKQLSKTKGKIYESYVINRIYHLINRVDLQIITQQYVRRPNGYALTDLYLPQLSMHIEVDEPHHGKQLIADIDREADIVEVTEHEIKRIKIPVDIGKKNKSRVAMNDVNKQIDKLCKDLLYEIYRLEEKSEWIPWTYDMEFDFSKYRNQGYISADQNTVFETILDGCNLIGQEYRGAQQAWYKAKKYSNHYLWFPKFYENDEWDNKMTDDGNEIIMFAKQDDIRMKSIESISKLDREYILVFPRYKNSLGQKVYKFTGEFKVNFDKSNLSNGVIYTRSSNKFIL